MNITFGAELEFADVKYGQPLPEGNLWNRQDHSIVNSNGIANCPTGTFYGYGGEINTKPTDSVGSQRTVFEEILECLDPKPVVNYRCNLHIHVGIPGLSKDLSKLKQLLRYIDTWQEKIFYEIELIPKPTRGQYPIEAEYKGAMKRYRRRKQSHQSVLSAAQVAKMLNASSLEEFYLAHFVTDKNGTPQKHLHQRCGINLRSLWENNETIEFRHFPGTLSPEEFSHCVEWCREFTTAALVTNEPADELLAYFDNKSFPKFVPYVHKLEQGYEQTCYSVKPESRKRNIARILNEGILAAT